MTKQPELTHACGRCGKTFDSDTSYLNHKCSETGFKPTQNGHFESAKQTIYSVREVNKEVKIPDNEILSAVRAARKA